LGVQPLVSDPALPDRTRTAPGVARRRLRLSSSFGECVSSSLRSCKALWLTHRQLEPWLHSGSAGVVKFPARCAGALIPTGNQQPTHARATMTSCADLIVDPDKGGLRPVQRRTRRTPRRALELLEDDEAGGRDPCLEAAPSGGYVHGEVAHIAAAVDGRVAVERLAPRAVRQP